MTKKQLLTTLTLSALALAQAGLVSADEVTPTDPSQPVAEVVTPTNPVSPVETPKDQPNQPAEPTQPMEPTQPVEPTTPTTPTDETPTTPTTEPTKPSETPTPSQPDTKPVETTPATPTPQPVSPQEGQVSSSTGQVVTTVSPQVPVETATGVSIVSTKEGKVVLSDGSEVAPETIGAKTNDDKTITVTKADGTKATLPHTGEAKTLGLSLLGVVMAFTGLLFWKKKKVQD